MTDYARAQRHLRYRRIAELVRILAVLAYAPEVYAVLRYHFPMWDDIALPLTLTLHVMASFVQRKTKMYEI